VRSCLGKILSFEIKEPLFWNKLLKGFGIYYEDNNEKKEINFNIISANLDQGASAAVRGFRILRKQEFFTKIDQQHYIVWADCGPHFRTQKFIGYLLLELSLSGITGFLRYWDFLKIILNYLIQKSI
jgi:hypothetical protein